jgi:hypothetical protein
MNEQYAEIKFSEVTPAILKQFLATASQRIIIAKAGYSENEIKQLLELIKEKRLICNLYFEAGEKAVRYGFGSQKALELIQENMNIIHVQSVNQIRMAIVIVDEAALVYAPTALAWEESPEKLEFPNGFFGGASIAETLFKQMGGEIVVLDMEERASGGNDDKQKIISIPVPPIPKKTHEDIKAELAETRKVLEENPPVDPATLRNTTFYRNRYKLLKMIIHGAKVKNKRIDLRQFNRMFPKTNNRLRASWSVLSAEDAKSLKVISQALAKIEKNLSDISFSTGRYGKLIKRKDMQSFEEKVEKSINELKSQLKGETSEEKQKTLPGMEVTVEGILSNSKKELHNYLYTLAIEEDSCFDKLFANERTLYKRMMADDDDLIMEDAVDLALETFIEDTLKFPTASDITDSIKVDFDYYDVSDELLGDENFIKTLEEFDVEVREYNQGFEKSNMP